MNGRAWSSLLACLALAAALVTGCTGGGGGGGQGAKNEEQGETQEVDINKVVGQWEGSKHSGAITFAAQRSFCVMCHDGGAFAKDVKDPKQLNRDFVVATDCRTCHTGKGADIVKAGKTTLPYGPQVSGGKGAVCMSCHNALSKPDIANKELGAPHVNPATEVLKAIGGMRTANMTTASTDKHATVGDACVSCHMYESGGIPSHTFAPGPADKICGRCHSGLKNFDRQAKGDYDGNGTKESIQKEVKGLMSILSSATVAAVPGAASFADEEGKIVFKGSGDATISASSVGQKAYLGAYNHTLILNDRSQGVHNPKFVVSLLQQSYKEVTGKDVPNATIVK